MIKNGLKLMSILWLMSIILLSCSKSSSDSTDSIIDDGGGNNTEVFTESIKMTIVKDGVESEITIDQYIGAFINVDEVDGYTFKKIEIATGWENTFPQMAAEFPFKVGSYEFGTTYGADKDFLDFFSMKFSEDSYYRENTEYADIVEGQWIQPWLEVLSIQVNSDNEYELEAIFGGTLIYHDFGSDSIQSLTIKTGTMSIVVADDYPDMTDNSASIANPPVVGGATGGGGGQNNIIADFEIRYPYSYVSGVAMLFDTATLTIVNKSSNAVTFDWELTSGDYWFPENYFFETTPVALDRFQKTMKLRNASDTCSFTVKLTAYDEYGNSKTAFRSVNLPMLHCVMFVDGVQVEDPSIICYKEYTSQTGSHLDVFGITFEKVHTFHFGDAGFFPTPGTVLYDLHQTGDYFTSNGNLSFYLEKSYPSGGITFNDPDGNFSRLEVNNYSIQIVNAGIYKIFGSVYAEYTLGGPGGKTGTVEFRYLAPYSHFYNF